jgi:photosystem II stability/assembly factor-like uncharacterized protein
LFDDGEASISAKSQTLSRQGAEAMAKSAKRKRTYSSNAKKESKSSRASVTAAYKPVKLGKRKMPVEKKKTDGSGPLDWLLPALESSYAPLHERTVVPQVVTVATASALDSSSQAMLAPARSTVWRDALLEYKQRKAAAVAPAGAPAAAAVAMPFVPGARNWLPLGPTVVLDGQTVGNQPVGGRVSRLAVAPGGAVVYAASANGGVFRSADGGTTWRSMMDRFDLDPTSFASSSLSCGAIALDPADPNRVYVGTGEGDTLQYFRTRVTGALPSYRGVGILRTDDGGANWIAEASSPDLAGEAFFGLAVDPHNREHVLAATTIGLYRRAPKTGGQFEWTKVRDGVHASVVVASSGGNTRFFAAEWGQGGSASKVFHSDDGGETWTQTGSQVPAGNIGRITVGVQADNTNLVYAFATTGQGALQGLYRLDDVAQAWQTVNGVPNVLPGGQGAYDLTLAVDPADANLIYLGGDRIDQPPFSGSVWRCSIQASGAVFTVAQSVSIGTHAHADVHFICHTPGDPNELWCTCDGGVFLNRDPKGSGEFVSQNNGLACLCSNFIAQHPTDPNILFTGLQDNGTARTASGPIWKHVMDGDGGYCLINWNKPDQVLVYQNGKVFGSTTGGASHDGWTLVWNFRWATMTQPVVGVPYDPANPASADLVAVGAGQLVYLSNDFANSWLSPITLPGGPAAGDAFAMAFASANRLFIATTRGQVFRADRSGNSWPLTRLDDGAGGALGMTGIISDIAVDWADASGNSVYVTFGGMGDRRRVWHFDGTRWEIRSGTGATSLLDVEHNALAVDRTAPNNVYVGADIGLWHSDDGGLNWSPLENGLPDAPVFDLQIHPTQRLLRAATHGRGVYEIPL